MLCALFLFKGEILLKAREAWMIGTATSTQLYALKCEGIDTHKYGGS